MKEQVTITNTTRRTLRLGGAVALGPGESRHLAPDARYLLERPIFKSYSQSGDISVERVSLDPKKKPKKQESEAENDS